MIDINSRIKTIDDLVSQNTPQSLAYAALECRLAIEHVCYERLRVAHNYISHEDLRGKWQPKDIVNILIQEVDENISSGFTLSISRNPAPDFEGALDNSYFEGIDYIEVGTQAGFDAKKMGVLWNALANLALHVQVPTSAADLMPAYGDSGKIGGKVAETLAELRKLAKGTMLSSGVGTEVSFLCECGTKNRRRAALIRDKQVVSCINRACSESYEVEHFKDEILFARRTLPITCNCGAIGSVPLKLVERLRYGHSICFTCTCTNTIYIELRPMQSQSSVTPAR